MTEVQKDLIHQLAGKLVDGLLTPPEKLQLQELLENSQENRRLYCEIVEVHASLAWHERLPQKPLPLTETKSVDTQHASNQPPAAVPVPTSVLSTMSTWHRSTLIVTGLLVAIFATYTIWDARPERVPVSGKILINGEPLSVGVIRFIPETPGRAAIGSIQKDGKFTLTSYELNDGATVGKFDVEISGTEMISESAIKWHAPKKYADHGMSGIDCEIDQTKSDIVIKLFWEEGTGPFTETL